MLIGMLEFDTMEKSEAFHRNKQFKKKINNQIHDNDKPIL